MKKLIVMAVAAMVAVSAMAAGMGDSMFYGFANGSEFWLDGSLQTDNPEFNGYQFGELYSLTLGAQIQAWPAGSAASNLRAGYKIFQGDDPGSDGWTDGLFGFVWVDDAGNNGANSRWVSGTEATKNWDAPAQTAVDLSGLTDGENYKIAVYFAGTVDGQDTGDYGNNFVASFTKAAAPVPEPATMSLLGLGALAMVLRRKLRK